MPLLDEKLTTELYLREQKEAVKCKWKEWGCPITKFDKTIRKYLLEKVSTLFVWVLKSSCSFLHRLAICAWINLVESNHFRYSKLMLFSLFLSINQADKYPELIYSVESEIPTLKTK